MRTLSFVSVPALAMGLLVAAPAFGAQARLNAALYPEGRTVKVAFEATDHAPTGARLSGKVAHREGQARIEIAFKKMKPALLFGGDVTAYVAWAIVPDGTAENLGELRVRGASGSNEYSTVQKNFALMVTGEGAPLADKPSDLVVFASLPVEQTDVQNSAFAFSDFTHYTKREFESIADREYKDKTPIDLKQAQKSVEIADRIQAEQINPGAVREARAALQRASKAGKGSEMVDYSRRAIALSAEAIRDTVRKRGEMAAAEAEAQRQAQIQALGQRATSAEAARERTAAALSESEQEKARLAAEADRLAAEKMMLEAERERLKRERDDLAHVLDTALTTVAEVTASVRGTVVNLPGILFDLNKSSLKSTSEVTIAKLAGILLVYRNAKLQIEGYTDSTGSEEINRKLSEARAKAVYDFLKAQGLDESRMEFRGLGPVSPIAPNDTAEGRSKNRRVEVVIEGVVKAAPGT